jgi:hypothetical protein
MTTEIQKYNDEVTRELSNKETMKTLITTTFSGLTEPMIKQAIVEGMMRGFTFKDFLEKNVYAIPFREKYSLVTSIDYARKIGMRSGIVGKSEPTYEEKDGKVISCSVTVKRKIQEYIGDYSAKVFFSEYSTGRSLWISKPRTMIAKVAEMHALRMACPEEMSQVYVEEEQEQETKGKLEPIDMIPFENKLKNCKTIEELGKEWSALPFEAKRKLETLKNQIKLTFDENNTIPK